MAGKSCLGSAPLTDTCKGARRVTLCIAPATFIQKGKSWRYSISFKINQNASAMKMLT
jgi:hypothetical protein